MDQKVLSLYALRSARGDVMKNAFFQNLLSDPYINSAGKRDRFGLLVSSDKLLVTNWPKAAA